MELILHKVKARLRRDHIQDLHGHGVKGLLHGIGDRNVAAVAAGGVHGPVSAVDLVHGAVLHRGGGLDLAQLDGRGIDGEGLDGRAWGPLTAGGPVQAATDGLFAQAAGHGHHFPAHVVHNGDGGLQSLAAAGDHVLILGVLVDLVHRRLDVRVHAGVDLQAAGEDLGLGVLLRPVVLVAQVLDDVVDDLVHIPGIDGVLFLGAVGLTVAVLVLIGVAEDQLFGGCLVVLLLGDVPLLQHGVEDGQLALLVEVLGGLDLAGVRVRDGEVAQGVILRGVVRDADEAGTFGQVQLRNVLAEIGVGGGVHAVAPLAQVDIVEVGLQNIVLGVLLLKLQGTEDLHDLSFHGDLIVAGHVLDQLLGQGRAALDAPAGEHQADGLGRADPVHAVVLVKALVLNGHGGILQILGDLIRGDPHAVFLAV